MPAPSGVAISLVPPPAPAALPALPAGFRYLPGVFTADEAAAALAGLLAETPWESHPFTMFGRTVEMPRRIAMYGPHGYAYSGVHHPPRPLTPRLEALRARVEAVAGVPFNSVLLNLYRDEHDSMGFHADDDYPCDGQPVIASVSFGAVRRFRVRPKRGPARTGFGLDLADGSVLLMGVEAHDWLHAIPKQAAPAGPRVNLTWRYMAGPGYS